MEIIHFLDNFYFFCIRVNAMRIITEEKLLSPSHTVPFFSHVAMAMFLQKGFVWSKIANFSYRTNPLH